ncbi:MAG: selenoneine biosynthesis selenosugar synthase SenB [Pseudomonadota bacterium]|nr:selenoneine biosynthesis selenosugar synthase SenB [Pseudomonadota bacterium]
MKISLITPAPKQSLSGNRKTASRWATLLHQLGHEVAIGEEWDGGPAELLMAVHAWRSADSVARFRAAQPDAKLIVLLAGTDIYRFQHSHPGETLRSMELADALVCLHDRAHRDIPKRFGKKLHVVYQSAGPLPKSATPSRRHFDICVVGHLRDEKDSLRTAYAARDLPNQSRIRILHLGRAHNADWEARAREEMRINPRYHWFDEVPRWRVRRIMARSRAMVLSSIMEGGANVISEAVAGGLPVIASDISGSVGLLGEDYAGYYPVGDTAGLAGILSRIEAEPKLLARLKRQCRAREKLFTPARERQALKKLLDGLVP